MRMEKETPICENPPVGQLGVDGHECVTDECECYVVKVVLGKRSFFFARTFEGQVEGGVPLDEEVVPEAAPVL